MDSDHKKKEGEITRLHWNRTNHGKLTGHEFLVMEKPNGNHSYVLRGDVADGTHHFINIHPDDVLVAFSNDWYPAPSVTILTKSGSIYSSGTFLKTTSSDEAAIEWINENQGTFQNIYNTGNSVAALTKDGQVFTWGGGEGAKQINIEDKIFERIEPVEEIYACHGGFVFQHSDQEKHFS